MFKLPLSFIPDIEQINKNPIKEIIQENKKDIINEKTEIRQKEPPQEKKGAPQEEPPQEEPPQEEPPQEEPSQEEPPQEKHQEKEEEPSQEKQEEIIVIENSELDAAKKLSDTSTIKELKEKCRHLGISDKGKKIELATRIVETS